MVNFLCIFCFKKFVPSSSKLHISCRAQLDKDNPIDFVDILLTHLEEAEPKNRLTQDQVLYELEDFLGGHCAVSNLLCRAIVEIADSPGMSDKIYVKVFI